MSPELLRMAKRAALPIHATFDGFYGDAAFPFAMINSDGRCWVAATGSDLARAYFALCESLTPNPDTSPSLVSGSDGCSAIFSPGDGL